MKSRMEDRARMDTPARTPRSDGVGPPAATNGRYERSATCIGPAVVIERRDKSSRAIALDPSAQRSLSARD